MTYKIGMAQFETLEARNAFLLRNVLRTMEYLEKKAEMSKVNNDLLKSAMKDLRKVIKSNNS